MNRSLVSIIIIISLIGCALALDGSGVGMQPGEATGVTQYSQYYTMPTGPATGTHIIAPQQYQISGNVPATVYFNDPQQAMPYDQYQSYTTYMGGNSLWIQGSTSWSQYAAVPQGAFLSLIATSSTGGNGYLNELYPDGRLLKNNHYYLDLSRLEVPAYLNDPLMISTTLFYEFLIIYNTINISLRLLGILYYYKSSIFL